MKTASLQCLPTCRVIRTFAAGQNPGGGFGGGHGHIAHCAPSYAVVLSLAMVGGTESLEIIDRRSLSVFSNSTRLSVVY